MKSSKSMFMVVILSLVVGAFLAFGVQRFFMKPTDQTQVDLRRELKIHSDNIRVLNEQFSYMSKRLEQVQKDLEEQRIQTGKDRSKKPMAQTSQSRGR